MIEATGFQLKSLELQKELVNHGYGDLVFRVESLKDERVKVTILCGKHYVFFIEKKKFNTIL